MLNNLLTPEEANVIVDKATEPPFTGEYDKLFERGVYLCRRCNTPLYRSESKFDANCGWPAFDDQIIGAIKRVPDADGSRMEIVCNTCDAHLGHVFTGEKITPKDTRHCVNSLSLRFIPYDFQPGAEQVAVIAGGCFWCLEAVFAKLKGVVSVESGYSGGQITSPNYEQVSAGVTGHAESVKIYFDQNIIDFFTLLQIFFYVHDPTTLNQQGHDVGAQYRSVIFYKTVKQKEDARKILTELNEQKVYDQPIVTEISPLTNFFPAEDYHKKYYEEHPEESYCRLVISPKLDKLKKKFHEYLK
ncbi:MAG: bifunctional methionine sulfoxide reductase B/A protein [bacterium]|nr:bifunctional methionine sulfoxide reductase B/A protein [bacterium]